jgi:hypothetical protein
MLHGSAPSATARDVAMHDGAFAIAENDFAEITITDDSGNVVTVSGFLKSGNHLARGG